MMDDFGTLQHGKDSGERKARDTRHDAELRKFIAYWTSMCRDGDVPLRTEIDPRGIESLLGNAFIAEKVAPGIARLRIAGSHLADVMGMEVRGMPLSALIDSEDRALLADALVDLFERPAQLRIELTSRGGLRRPALSGTLLIMPLRSDLGDISRALGCFVSNGPVGTTPRRFRIAECHITPIDLTVGKPSPGFAEPLADYAAPAVSNASGTSEPIATRHPSERHYLRLVHSR